MQTLSFTIKTDDLASFHTDQLAWIADPGKYTVKIGASSENIKLNSSFTLPRKLIVEKVREALTPQIKIDELKTK
jgi:beta-glucosidase